MKVQKTKSKKVSKKEQLQMNQFITGATLHFLHSLANEVLVKIEKGKYNANSFCSICIVEDVLKTFDKH